MFALLCLLFTPAQVVESKDFPKELQQAALAATVLVQTDAGEASGVIVGKKPFVYVLTANHVVDGARLIDVMFFPSMAPSDRKVYHGGKVIARAKTEDLAVIQLVTGDPVPGLIQICPPASTPKERRFPVLTVGCVGARGPTCIPADVLARRLVRLPGAEGTVHYWEVNKRPHAGRSGGPLLDKQGLLIGICSGTNNDLGYYTQIEEIHKFLRANALKWLYEEKQK